MSISGDMGASFMVEPVGGDDLRDRNENLWTNMINGATTAHWWDDGQRGGNANQRVDITIFDQPGAFRIQSLTSITITDPIGTASRSQVLAPGLTAEISEVPLPPAALLLGAGVPAPSGLRRRA